MIKTLREIGICGNVLNLIKRIHKKPTANIILTGDLQLTYLRLKDCCFSPKIGNRMRIPAHILLFNIVQEIRASVIREENEMKCIQFRKEEIKLSLFAENMIVYPENCQESIKSLLELI